LKIGNYEKISSRTDIYRKISDLFLKQRNLIDASAYERQTYGTDEHHKSTSMLDYKILFENDWIQLKNRYQRISIKKIG
jgi:hypothetical protein